MAKTNLLSTAWYKALTLTERSSALPGGVPSGVADNGQDGPGQLRFQRWQAQPQFTEEEILKQRLELPGISEEELVYLLGETADSIQARLPDVPWWITVLTEAFAYPSTAFAELVPGEEELGFLELVQPLVDRACDFMYRGVQELGDRSASLPFDPQNIEDILLMNLPDPLLMRLGRTMVLELNVARLQGLLDGDSPEERFTSFIELLRRPEAALALLEDYPVLARQLVTCIEQWLDVGLEFLDRLCQDWPAIRRQFCPDSDPGMLVELTAGAGDTHRDGRSVMIARFESGFRLVYKPKSMAVDIHFQELLDWLNERGCTPALRTMSILDRESHGWVEYVEYQECQSLEQVENFYQRLGLYLALLYAINASDFHLENLIAEGEHPLLIDLETLFNPEFDRFDEDEAVVAAQRSMVHSVLVAGMLPQRMWSGNDYGGIDISGFGGEAGQLTPDRLPRAAGMGTDEMRYVRERLELTGEANRPRLNGVEISALDYVETVVAGFRRMYRLLTRYRDELLAPSGPLERFADDEVRVLLRPTRTYDQLLFESFHPDMLHDALDRDLLFDRLWLVVPDRQYMAPVVAAEQTDMQLGDIPVFTTRPASVDLISGSGEIIEGVLTESGLEIARRRVAQFGEADQRQQEWFIRASLATLMRYDYGFDLPERMPYQLGDSVTEVYRTHLMDGARKIADRLLETAVLGEKDVVWLGLEMLAEASWDVSPVGMDLYNGVPGITLFLAYAGEVLQEKVYTTLARRGLNGMLQHVELFGEELPGVGGYEGWGGMLYALTHLGMLWQDSAVLERAGEIADLLANYLEQDESYGVQSGAAGAIGALLAYNTCVPSARVLDIALACGDFLLAAADSRETGLGWALPGSEPPPLTGLAFGAAGIAWALLALSEVTGDGRFRRAAQLAIAYERTCFSAKEGNWPDLRQADPGGTSDAPSAGPRYPIAWCHGAAGIGLARLAVLNRLDDSTLLDEIRVALNTTLKHGFGQSHCLCHGDMGNLELLLSAARMLDDANLARETQRMTARILASMDRTGWYCGGPDGVELPGLMLGIAGIGYEMLRLADPETIPNVLIMAPPTKRP